MSYLGYRFTRKEFHKKQICFSAERSLFIAGNGNVTPCCFNRKVVYGNILAKGCDIDSLLYNRKEMESKLKENNFSNGCEYCEKILKQKNYKAAGSLKYDLFLTEKKGFLRFIEFELDTFCNLDCVMCPPELHSKKQQNVFDQTFIEKIKSVIPGLKWAKFYGGEPFLIKIYYEIWTQIIKLNPKCQIIVQTNATILNDKIKSLLELGNFRLSVSMDSLNEKNYNLIRRGADFSATLKNLNYFIDYSKRKNVPLNITICPMTINMYDIPDLIKFSNNNKLFIFFNHLQYPQELCPQNLTSLELKKIIEVYKKTKISLRNLVSLEIIKHFKSLINQLEYWHKIAEQRDVIPVLEVKKEILLNIILTQLDKSESESIKEKFISAFTFLKEDYKIRQDTYTQLNNLPIHQISEYFDKHSSEEVAIQMEKIIRYGF